MRWSRKSSRARRTSSQSCHGGGGGSTVGINSGDILITPSGAMHGDAINVAARIQALAPPGGILVTGVVHDQLQGHGLVFEYVRTSALKNLSRKVCSYRLDF